MRSSSNVIIYIDVAKALAAGIRFQISSNGVILSSGGELGRIPPEFFETVIGKSTVLVLGAVGGLVGLGFASVW